MDLNPENAPPIDVSQALIPKAMRVIGNKQDGEAVVVMEVWGHPADSETPPRKLSDLTPTVFAFDQTMYVKFLEFATEAGFKAFGLEAFFAGALGQEGRSAQQASKAAGRWRAPEELVAALLQNVPCDDSNCEVHGAKVKETPEPENSQTGMYL